MFLCLQFVGEGGGEFPFGDLPNKSMRFNHITEMTIVTVQLIVEFAKRIPGFETLLQNDQITLLKVSRMVKSFSNLLVTDEYCR